MMAEPITEEYWWGENRQVLTKQEHGIPGIRIFGHSLNTRALLPLETHVHPGCLELVLLTKGNQTYTMDGKTYPLSGGNVFISPPGAEHSSGGEPQNISEIYWVQIELSGAEDLLCLGKEAGEMLRRRLSGMTQRVIYCEEGLRQFFVDSFWNTASKDACRQEYGRCLLAAFLYGVVLQEKAGTIALSDEIGTAVSFIRQNIRENIALEELADCAGLSLSRFKARFKTETGMTPREYINQLKIKEAKKMLRQGYNVTQVAMELGFSSSNYFATLFKKITLYTPTVYQKEHIS